MNSKQNRGINAPRVMRANERLRNREDKKSKGKKSHRYHWVIRPALLGEGRSQCRAQLWPDGVLVEVALPWQETICVLAGVPASGVEHPAV